MLRDVYCGMPYVTFVPREIDTEKSVLYVHGSTYMNEPRFVQVAFAKEIARKTHAKVFFPLYPKLPVSTVLPCFALLNNFFSFLYKKGKVLPIGDSSGGALALALAATRAEITEVIAISPWLSISLCEEGRSMRSDAMLSVETLDLVGELWAGGLPDEDVRLSPMQGEFKGKTILLTCGEKERFRPDIMHFCELQRERGASVRCLEGAGQQHCYPLMPTPEGRRARGEILRVLQKGLYGEKQ